MAVSVSIQEPETKTAESRQPPRLTDSHLSVFITGIGASDGREAHLALRSQSGGQTLGGASSGGAALARPRGPPPEQPH